MEKIKPISCYGIIRTEEDMERDRKNLFIYYQAVIAAYKLNPETDWGFEEGIKLLKTIGSSCLDEFQRTELIVNLFGYSTEED